MPFIIPQGSIGPLITLMGSVAVELSDSNDSIEDRLLMSTLPGARLKEELRSRKC